MEHEKKKTVLIVEDELPLLSVYADRFMEEGFLVLKAFNGKEGLALAMKEKPDLIILDISMPIMDGLAMMRKLREGELWGKKVPIMLLTNLSADQKKIDEMIEKNKPLFYLIKLDWSLDSIVDKAKSVLREINE